MFTQIYKKSIIQPYFSRTKNDKSSLSKGECDMEIEFIEWLENEKRVKWWLKNGKQDILHFVIPYFRNGARRSFYVNFVIMTTNGSMGLFDTNGGVYAQTAEERAEGLAAYIRAENEKGKKFFGGIVVRNNGSWRYNDGEKYNYNSGDLKEWKFLGF